MTRAEQPTALDPAPDDALVADSRERAVRALLRRPQLKRLWSAQLVGGIGDTLALLVLVLLALQAAIAQGSFGGGYRGLAFAVATVFGTRILATLLFGAVLLGPLTSLTSHEGPLDRRWTMVGADGVRLALLIVAPLWIDWTPDNALAMLLVTAFVTGVAERFWTVCRESAAPALLPEPPRRGRRYGRCRTTWTHCAACRCGRRSWRSRWPVPRSSSPAWSTTCWAPASTGSASTRRPSRRTSRPVCSPRPCPC